MISVIHLHSSLYEKTLYNLFNQTYTLLREGPICGPQTTSILYTVILCIYDRNFAIEYSKIVIRKKASQAVFRQRKGGTALIFICTVQHRVCFLYFLYVSLWNFSYTSLFKIYLLISTNVISFLKIIYCVLRTMNKVFFRPGEFLM